MRKQSVKVVSAVRCLLLSTIGPAGCKAQPDQGILAMISPAKGTYYPGRIEILA